jgi:Rrf2 family transcriptional regulator, iron-sulfur cluster assembly transcription factor
MLKINRQTDYAVRVILALAKQGEGARLSSSVIQRQMLIPQALMPRIVAQLAHARLINTFPGRDGGLMLSRAAAQITLRDVVEAFEGPILLSECLEAKGEDDCPFRTNCPVSPKWGRVQVAMLREMAAITFESLAQEALGVPVKTLSASMAF